MHGSVWNLLLLFLLATSGAAQIGGTGKDGALAPKSDLVLDTTQNKGVFQFTRIDIPRGVKVTIKGSHPAVLRVQSTVKITGSLNADGLGSGAGPGGYAGGRGSQWLFIAGKDGGGPGGGKGGWFSAVYHPWLAGGPGGHATEGPSGPASWWRWIPGKANGSAFPFTLIGGSGGGGACGTGSTKAGNMGGYGGGGGGVIVILADGAIRISGTITADGGDSWEAVTSKVGIHAGGPGAGGSILLRSMRSVTVDKTGLVRALGGHVWPKITYGRYGGKGFVRFDSYGSAPVIQGKVEPKPMALELPHIVETIPPRLGRVFGISCASVPGDLVAIFISKRGAKISTPFGVLRLDPSANFFLLGALGVPATGHDPIGSQMIAVHTDPRLIGLGIHIQAINLITKSGRPRLSNALITQILE